MRNVIFILLFSCTLCITSSWVPAHPGVTPSFSSDKISMNSSSDKTLHSIYSWSIQNNYVISYLEKIIDKVTRAILTNEYRRNSLLKTLVPVLSVLIMLLFINSLLIVFYVFTIKTLSVYKEKRIHAIRQKYLAIIADYLVKKKQSDYPQFPGLYKPLNRKTLIDQIYLLSQSLFGSKQNKLLKLFRIRLLLKHVLFRIAISGKDRKAVYLKLFSVIIPNQHLDNKFRKYLFSKHHELRRFAQLASLNYNTKSLDDILNEYPYSLTLWDQIHFLEVIDRRSTIPPDFYPYLKSTNPTVILFGLRMIRTFYQKSKEEKLLVNLLSHSEGNIRYEALKTILDLNVEGVNQIILAYLSEIGEKYKVLVMEYMIKNNLLDDDTLFKFFYSENKELDRLNILKTVYNNYPNGEKLLIDFKNYTEDEKTQSMCKYILENAL